MQKKTDGEPGKSPPPGLRPMDLLAVVVLTACCFCWGLNQVALKITNEGISPLYQAAMRFAIAAVLIWMWCVYRRIPLFARDGTLRAGMASGTLFAVNFMFIAPGLSLTEASRGVLFYFTAPFFVAAGAHYLIPGDRLTLMKVLGLSVAFVGLMICVSERLGEGGGSLVGDMMCLAAAFFWALTTLVIRTTSLRHVSPEKNLFYELVVAVPALVIMAWLLGEPGVIALSPLVVGAFLYSTLIVVFVSYTLWFWLLKTYPASQVSVFTFLAPIFGVLAGYLILSEPVTWRLGVALTLVALGIYLVNKPSASA